MDEIITKKCSKCGLEKPLSDYYTDKRREGRMQPSCKLCQYEYTKEWRKNNPEKKRAQGKRAYYAHREDCIKRVKKWSIANKEVYNGYIDRWHKAHREKGLISARKYRASNPDKERERTRKYRASHPDKVVIQVERRRARKLNGGGNVTEAEWAEIKEKYGNRCLDCNKDDVVLSMDHVVPLSLGGLHEPGNIQPLCISCNSKKHTKIIDYRNL